MRWNTSKVAFSRPVRWLLALFGEQVIPFEYAGLVSGRGTRGLRFNIDNVSQVPHLPNIKIYIEGQGIILDPGERKLRIQTQVAASGSRGGWSRSG